MMSVMWDQICYSEPSAPSLRKILRHKQLNKGSSGIQHLIYVSEMNEHANKQGNKTVKSCRGPSLRGFIPTRSHRQSTFTQNTRAQTHRTCSLPRLHWWMATHCRRTHRNFFSHRVRGFLLRNTFETLRYFFHSTSQLWTTVWYQFTLRRLTVLWQTKQGHLDLITEETVLPVLWVGVGIKA